MFGSIIVGTLYLGRFVDELFVVFDRAVEYTNIKLNRKCGRVVCNSCSPHRITIPYQFIVQPPQDGSAASVLSRPPLDPSRAGSAASFTTLGGGERVRLCNPCVPDPNIAPPQTPALEPPPQRPSRVNAHNRSSSLATSYYTPPPPQTQGSSIISPSSAFPRRPRETSYTGVRRGWARPEPQSSSSLQTEHLLRMAAAQGGRSRASTVS